jgi:L-rhamnose isomerase/sugar isomerase
MSLSRTHIDRALRALDRFAIELPSWGFADTGTRFGKFFQDAAASTTAEKFHDAGLVHRLTGACPTVAVHVLWDFNEGEEPTEVAKLAQEHGVRIGSINPNVFQDQVYKAGSLCSPDDQAREQALNHCLRCVEIGRAVDSKLQSLWLADGTNYPGQDNLRARKHRLHDALKRYHDAMDPAMTLLVEYKPFEPGFYHTDIADWGMAAAFARHAGPRAKVLVDTGHHLPGANIEHIVAFLLDEQMLGGFHFNDRKYADDDLTLGSIDPYAVFRIFAAIAQHEHDTGVEAGSSEIAYMVDQSHNLKPKLEAMVQTVVEAQKQFARAHLVDRAALADAQAKQDIVAAESLMKQAFEADVTPILQQWRQSRNLPIDPLAELRESGVIAKLGAERKAAREARGEVQAASYA